MKMVEIEATSRCNTRCLHCPREAISRPMGTMSWDTYKAVVDKVLKAAQFEAIYFSGMGEPTLNPALPRFVAEVSDRIATAVTTNGSTLTASRIAGLVDAGLQDAIVSFTGHTPEMYGLMTGGLSLASVDEHIRELVARGGSRLSVSANVSVTLQNRAHLAQIESHLRRLGVREVTFALCHNRGGFLDDPEVCATPAPPTGAGRCDIFGDTLYVAWSGQVLSCCHDLAGQGYVGNLVTEELDSVLARKERILDQGVHFPMCRSCNDMYRFGGDRTPDGSPLSEWVYALAAAQGEREAKLVEVIRQREARIRELEETVSGYERGRFMRFTRWLRRNWGRLTGGSR